MQVWQGKPIEWEHDAMDNRGENSPWLMEN
jgi:hypothetical protein